MGRRIASLLVVVLGTLAIDVSPAMAASFTYPSAACPAGPTGLTDCISGASAGDTVKVKKGTYFENVLVNVDVTVKAAKCDSANKVTIDAAPPAPPLPGVAGIGFDIGTDGVTIDCITVRHATIAVDNDFAGAGFDNITVRRLTSLYGGDGVFSQQDADNMLVERSLFKHSDGDGIEFNGGNDLLVQSNRCQNLGNDCIDISDAFQALVKGNVSRLIDDGGLVEVFESDEVEIRNNRGQDSDNPMVEVDDSADFIVDGNFSKNASDNAFDMDGVDFQLTNNTAVGYHDDEAIDVFVEKDPVNVLISGNDVSGSSSPDDDNSFEVTADLFSSPCAAPPCVRILNNRAGNSAEDGFSIQALFTEIRGNTSSGNGESDGDQGDGFDLDVSTSTVVQNTATDNTVDGFNLVNSGNNEISGNVSKGNGHDGIHLESRSFALSNLIDDNQAIGNFGDGIENDADDVSITNNVSKKNRFDCASSVVLVANTGNTCADGSNFTVDGTID